MNGTSIISHSRVPWEKRPGRARAARARRGVAPTHVGPIVDFLDAVRHERVAIERADGIVVQEPPQPSFSLKGRTLRSLWRLMEAWHRGLGLVRGDLSWDRSRLRPMALEVPRQDAAAPPLLWELTELTNSRAAASGGGGSSALCRELRPSLLARHVTDLVASLTKRVKQSLDHHDRGGPCAEGNRPGAGLPQSTAVKEGASTAPEVGGARTPPVGDVTRRPHRQPLASRRARGRSQASGGHRPPGSRCQLRLCHEPKSRRRRPWREPPLFVDVHTPI